MHHCILCTVDLADKEAQGARSQRISTMQYWGGVLAYLEFADGCIVFVFVALASCTQDCTQGCIHCKAQVSHDMQNHSARNNCISTMKNTPPCPSGTYHMVAAPFYTVDY